MESQTRPTSIREIATKLGVSTATVSNALRGTGRVSSALAEQIRLEADRLGYVPDHAARALRTGKSNTVGLLVPNIGQPLFPAFAQAIERAAKRRGLAVLIGDSQGDPQQQEFEIRTMIARGVDALIVIPTRGTTIAPTDVPVPVAVIDSAATVGNIAASDHRQGGRLIARHLVDLGHDSILILAGPENSLVARERVEGMREVFRQAGVEPALRHSDATFEAGSALGRELDLRHFTACAAAYDALAVGFAITVKDRGFSIPEDISLTGFDDLMWAQIVSPPLTTVRQDLEAVANHALAFVAGEIDISGIFPTELVLRQSTARPSAFAKGGRHAE
ncbi:LacI family transcriptional regulator [Rhizobium sp. ERR 922]|uniref:LacI family DNA-binding transcriptional regulator n=1 Tax=unclassified Rhizobium TaxID=2613769 RepID=UPI000DDFEAEA|nr:MULTISPECIES: LacI family DNA-binding transcriptional regulator [unclassified Rhizobium]MCZ3374642.1 LacI family DNA-binding transcriptional regulator [Rhizobium sp. AG207R]TWB10932.1 LacI family transcriptional regulator [Rhizobium sp. ERR1071]TWB48597.1 LacI family transcriptional regulator [Rhizobium sp. ERR 922]TWB90318.1 LacI family transcriptional regulator [Rhizobium sp. ERR 942]